MTLTGKFTAIAAMASILFVGVQAANRSERAPLTDNDYAALSICEGVIRLFQAESSRIWPGYNLADRSFIVYIPGRWALLFNGAPDAEGFSSYPKEWPNLGINVLYHQGQYRDLIGQLAFGFEVGKQKVVAVGFPEKRADAIYLFGFLVHEAFHQYQDEKFGDIPWEREERYPILDRQNTALAYLEMRALMDALRAAYAGNNDATVNKLGQFVAVRQERWTHADPFVKRYEQGQEIREGTARYVEMKSVELLTKLKYRSSIPQKVNALRTDLPSVSMPGLLLDDFKSRITSDSVAPDDMLRNRIYPVGAALGLLADYLKIDWKPKAQQAGTAFEFGGLFAAQLGLDEGRMKKLLNEAEGEYDLGKILVSTETLTKAYRKEYEAALAAFEAQKGLRVEIDFSYTGLSRSRYSRTRKWLMDQGSVCLCPLYDVYTLKKDRFSLQLQSFGVLERDDWSARKKGLIFYIPRLGTVTVDQKPLGLGQGMHVRFRSLKIQEGNFRLESSGPGELSFDGHRLVITLK